MHIVYMQYNSLNFNKIRLCGENVGKILYKNGLQVSVGHLRVPGAGDESLCLKKIMKLEYMYINY